MGNAMLDKKSLIYPIYPIYPIKIACLTIVRQAI